MIAKALSAYRRYFLSHIPAHFIGFVMGVLFMGFIVGTLLPNQCYFELTDRMRHG